MASLSPDDCVRLAVAGCLALADPEWFCSASTQNLLKTLTTGASILLTALVGLPGIFELLEDIARDHAFDIAWQTFVCPQVARGAAAIDPQRLTRRALEEAASPISSPPAIPVTPPPATVPVTLPTSVARGDVYRLTFRTTPSAWSSESPPGNLSVFKQPGSGCTELAVDIYDGSRRLASNAANTGSPPNCSLNVFSASGRSGEQMDFASIRSGTIDGRIDIRILGSGTVFDQFWFAILCPEVSGADCPSGGLTVTSRILIKAPGS